MSFLNLLRKKAGKDKTAPAPYPKRYNVTMQIKIKGITIARYDMELNANNRDHALRQAKLFAQNSMGVDWKIKPIKATK